MINPTLTTRSALRTGEVAGLQVRDVNMLRRVLRVERQLQRTTGGGLAYTTPKMSNAYRYVPLQRSLVDQLAAYLAEHPCRDDPTAPLFPGRQKGGHRAPDHNRHMDPASFYRYYLKPAAAHAGLEAVRAHDLRHTYAAIAAASGIEIQKVSRFMGHHSIAVTADTYGHLFHSDFDADMDRLNHYVDARSSTPVRDIRRSV